MVIHYYEYISYIITKIFLTFKEFRTSAGPHSRVINKYILRLLKPDILLCTLPVYLTCR